MPLQIDNVGNFQNTETQQKNAIMTNGFTYTKRWLISSFVYHILDKLLITKKALQ